MSKTIVFGAVVTVAVAVGWVWAVRRFVRITDKGWTDHQEQTAVDREWKALMRRLKDPEREI